MRRRRASRGGGNTRAGALAGHVRIPSSQTARLRLRLPAHWLERSARLGGRSQQLDPGHQRRPHLRGGLEGRPK
eukprot:11537486-Alexandrium_andersonii.AAC.1